MAQGFLMDTNVVVDYLSDQLPLNSSLKIDNVPGIISVVTRIELLGWYKVRPERLTVLQAFINSAQILDLSEDVILQSIKLRQKYKIKLPDAIIAATAIIYNYTLLTRNVSDFNNIAGLHFENPWLWQS